MPGASSVAAASISPFREADGDLVYVSYDGATGSELTIGVDTAARSIGLITYSGATTGGALSVDVIHSFPSVGDGTTGIPQISAENQMVGSIYVAGSIGSIVGGTFGEGETISTLSAGAAGDVGNISLEGDVLGGIHVGGDLVGTISAGSILGDLSIGGDLASEGNIITSGTLGSGWWITVSGDLAGDILVGADLAASVSVGGDMSGTLTAGNLLGDSSIGGDMSSAGQIIATGGSEFGTAMSVSGSLRGNVQIGGDVSVHVYHDLSGTLAAANFGNITIGNGVIRTGNVTSSGTIATNGSLGNFIVWGTHGSNIYVAQGIQGEYKQYGAQASYNLGDVAFPFWSHMDFAETDGDVVHVSYDGPWQSWITLTLGANGEGIQDVTYSYAGEGTTEGWSLGVTATGGDGQTSVGAIYAGDSIVRAIEITGTLGALSAGYLPYGSTISATNIGNITLTDWLDGDIYASGDVTGLIYAACEISGNIVIDGHLSGTIQTYQDLWGVISAGSGGSGGIVVGGNVTETAAIYTGSTLSGLTVSGHNWGWTGGGPILSYSVGDSTGWPTGYSLTSGAAVLFREGDGDILGVYYSGPAQSSVSIALDAETRSVSAITYAGADADNALHITVLDDIIETGNNATIVGEIVAQNQILGTVWVQGTIGGITASAMMATGGIDATTIGAVTLQGTLTLDRDVHESIVIGSNTSVSMSGHDLLGRIYVEGDFSARIDMENLVGRIFVEGDLNGAIVLTGNIADTASAMVAGGLVGTLSAANMAGDIGVLGGMSSGSSITGTGDLSGRITIVGGMAGTIAIQGSIAANGVVIAGSELSGRIHAGCDLSGSIFVGSGGSGVIGIGNGTAGSITESGLVYTGDTLGGLTVSGHNWGWVGGTFGDYVLGSTASPPSTYGLSVGTALAFRESDGDLVRISYEGATGDPMTILLHDGTRSIEGITCSGISEGDDISVQVTRGPAGDGYTTVDGITLSDACLGQITVQGTLGSFLASSLGTGGVITACGFSSISLTGGDLAGTITDTGDLGDISVAGDISGKIAVEGQLFGTLQTHQDLSGTISIKGGGTGGIIIGDGITGDITTAGAVYCGSTLSGITISGQNLGTVLGTLGTYVVGGSSSSNYVAYDLDVFTVTDDSDPTNQAVDGSDNDSALSTPLYVMEGTDGTATINLGLSWTTDPGNVNASAYTWRVVKTDGTIVCSGDFDDSTTVSFDGPPSGSTDPADGLVIVQVFGANGQDRRDIPVCVYTPGSLCCMTDYFTNWLATRSTSCADSPRDVLIDRLREKLEQLGEEYDRLSAEVDAALAELQQQDDLMKRTQEKIAYWKGEADFMHTTFMHLVEVFWVAPSYAYLAGYIASALGASATGVGAVSIVVGGGVAFSMAEYPEFRLLNNMYAQITQEADRAGARNNYVDLWDSQTDMLEEIQRTEAALSAVQHQGSSR